MNKNTPVKHEKEVETIERFVSLNAGNFWQVISDDIEHDMIDKGDILLITQIDYVDNQAHTLYVRIHPRNQSAHGERVAKFRVDDFLSKFIFVEAESAQEDREQHLQEIQSRINSVQKELTDASADSDVLDQFIERDYPEESTESKLPVVRQALPNGVVGAIKTQKVSALMTRGLTESGVDSIKSAMSHQVSVIQKRSDWLRAKSGSLSTIISEMTPYFSEQAAVALAETSSMRSHIDKLMEGIESLDLYTLKGVDIFNIAEGKSASEDEKLTITQSVLYMDEELAVFTPVNSRSFDCRDREKFFDVLSNNQELIDQIFPTDRCMVGMATTRHQRDYSGYSARRANELDNENALVFFLIRDGENIHGVVSGNVMHQFTPRLFPRWDDLERPFKGLDGTDITYDDIQYTNSLDKFEKMSLAYKRILILMCGLDHNHTIFGRFYSEGESLNFITQEFQAERMNFVFDDDGTNMLSGKAERSISEWLNDMNTSITSGSRVLIDWKDCFTTTSCPSAFERENNWNRNNSWERSIQYTPDAECINKNYIECIVEIAKGVKFLTIPVSGDNNNYEHREFNARLNLDIAMHQAEKYSVICLDRIEPSELKTLLQKRSQRKLNVAGINAIKAAIYVSERDHADELAIRHRMYSALEVGGVATGTDALKLITDAVAVFRCANKGASLNIVDDNEKKYNELLDQMFVLLNTPESKIDLVIKKEEQKGRSVIRVSIDTKGVLVAYSTPLESERDDRLIDFAWVVKTRYKSIKSGVSGQKPTLIKLYEKVGSESVKYEIENVKDYVFPSDHPWSTPKAKSDSFIDENLASKVLNELEAARVDDDAFESFLFNYKVMREESVISSMVNEPVIMIPLATVLFKNKTNTGIVGLALDALEVLIYLCNEDEKRLELAKHEFVSIYNRVDVQSRNFDKAREQYKNKTILELGRVKVASIDDAFGSTLTWLPDFGFRHVSSVLGKEYSIQARIEHKFHSHIMLNGVGDNADKFLGAKKPDNYYPCAVISIDTLDNYILIAISGEQLKGFHLEYKDDCFDTIEDAESYMSKKSVNCGNGDGNYTEAFYINTPNDAKVWTSRRTNAEYEIIKSWTLDRPERLE